MDDQIDASGSVGGSDESVFSIVDPQGAVINLTRLVVNGQKMLCTMREAAKAAEAAQGLAPEQARRVVDKSRDFEQDWNDKKLPLLIVSMRLALEVLDTFGPEGVTVDDPIEAAIWNNKTHVWLKEIEAQRNSEL
ncbi:hypothetical protein A5768_26270 [Mycolicibacterium fortuitum]|uniref:hypothetical protein n=1 Tax=Mycolicibacterium fortuitum TaxID=1766 RepID=UPI0007EB62FB|nr:hypothetical protein [Mycolicibacterium fortuitum]OBG21609.1 hypothetical protein A5768_26270 [Mycolicibacterium fortuitum]